MKVTYCKFWTRKLVENDPDNIYIFGDNTEGWGTGGQACIRGLKNAYGIPTKITPYRYMSDRELAFNAMIIKQAIENLPRDKNWVLPEDGLGTGLADLPNKAPKTYQFLLDELNKAIKEHTKC